MTRAVVERTVGRQRVVETFYAVHVDELRAASVLCQCRTEVQHQGPRDLRVEGPVEVLQGPHPTDSGLLQTTDEEPIPASLGLTKMLRTFRNQ